MRQKKRITINDRINLQASLEKHLSWKETAKVLRKDRSTIFRELKNYSTIRDGKHTCEHCSKRDLCRENNIRGWNRTNCEQFSPIFCSRLNHYPFVCNGCENNKKM